MLVVVRGLYVGFRSGFFSELLRVVSYGLALVAAFHFGGELAEFLTLKTFLNQATASAAAFAAIFAGVFLAAKLLTAIVLKLIKQGEGGFLSRLAGSAVGVCRWLVLLSLIFMLIDYVQLAPLKSDVQDKSVSGPYVARIAPMLFDFLSSLSPQLSGVRQ